MTPPVQKVISVQECVAIGRVVPIRRVAAVKKPPVRSWLRSLRPRLVVPVVPAKKSTLKKKPKPESVRSWLRVLRPRK